MKKIEIWAAALFLAVSCGGGAPAYDGPYVAVDGIYTITAKGETIQLAEMPAGTFTMGETLDMGRYRTPAVHQVILDGFAIGTTEVTQALWKAVMGSNPSPKDVPTAPVTMVSYGDAQKFLQKLSKATGVPFRLPTEAEWEYAARGGKKSHGYPFAGSAYPQGVAQYGYDDMRTRPVARYSPNELGLYDMSGNAWEWCQDRPGPYGSPAQTNPTGPDETALGDVRVMRGGSVATAADKCRVSNRNEFHASNFRSTIGFRLVL